FLVYATLLGCALCSSADEFDTLRLRWRDMLTFGTNATKSDTNYFNWISSVEATAQKYLKSMNTNAGRTNLWTDPNANHPGIDSGHLAETYTRLRYMAMGYAVQGASNANSVALRIAITNGLDWVYTNYYNERKSQYANTNKNWFDWEIAIPLRLNDTTVLIYSNLLAAQVT